MPTSSSTGAAQPPDSNAIAQHPSGGVRPNGISRPTPDQNGTSTKSSLRLRTPNKRAGSQLSGSSSTRTSTARASASISSDVDVAIRVLLDRTDGSGGGTAASAREDRAHAMTVPSRATPSKAYVEKLAALPAVSP